MPDQRLSTTLQLDAVLGGGYKDAFSSASDLMSDLKKESGNLRKELKKIGKEADEVEKVGTSAESLRRDMRLLERQIKETERATEKFGDSRRHFRSAGIGARALRSDIGAIAGTARNVALAIAGIGTAAALALSPSEEALEFDQTIAGIAAISPEVDTAGIESLKMDIRGLSNAYGVTTSEIAMMHSQLTRNLGFDDAQQTITAAVEFQTATGLSITDLEEELATARISLGIDTPAETREFLQLLQSAKDEGIKIDNLDLGDLETLGRRTGEDIFGKNFQKELLTILSFRQLDSVQLGDYTEVFQEEFARSIVITPQMDSDAIKDVRENIKSLERFGIRAEDGILGAMEAFRGLNKEQQAAFREQLSPILSEGAVEVIARGAAALPEITQQVDAILTSERSLTDAAQNVATTWSGVWGRIGITGSNTLGILQEQFAGVFGPSILSLASRFFDFVASNAGEIRSYFTGIRDGITPIVSRIWNTIREAYPDIKAFAIDVWVELRKQFKLIAPVIQAVGGVVMDIARAIGEFAKEHPRLVATLITGVVAWKAYQIAAGGFGVVADIVKGTTSLVQGHLHRLNATILQNARVSGTLQTASLSIGKVFGGIGRAALSAIPGIAAMGGTIAASILPALPVILPVVAAVTALASLFARCGVLSSQFHTRHYCFRAELECDVRLVRRGHAKPPSVMASILSFWKGSSSMYEPLPVVAAVTALGAAAYIVYRNWEPIKAFFIDNFDTIRNVLLLVFPPLGLLVSFAGVIKQNWEGVKEFFTTIWETIKLTAMVAFETVKFVGLNALLAIKKIWVQIPAFFGNLWQGVADIFLATPLAPIFQWMTENVMAVVRPLFGFFDNFWQNIADAAGRVLNWITDKFKAINGLLQKVLGWLRDRNEEIQDELKVVGQVAMDVSLPELQIAKAGELNQTVTQTAAPDVKVDIPTVEMPDVGVQGLDPMEMPEQMTMPAMTPVLDTPDLQTAVTPRSDTLVKIGLGTLAEARKQTLLLEGLSTVTQMPDMPAVETGEIPTMPDVGADIPPVTMDEIPPLQTPDMPDVGADIPPVTMDEMPPLQTPAMPDVGLDIPPVTMDEIPTIETGVDIPAMPDVGLDIPPITIDEIPPLQMQDMAMPTAPSPIQLQEYEVPAVVKEVEREVSTETEGEAQAASSPQPANNVTLNFNISQAPGQDPEELAKIIMRQINESTGTFLVQ